jgi:hypothetical protein
MKFNTALQHHIETAGIKVYMYSEYRDISPYAMYRLSPSNCALVTNKALKRSHIVLGDDDKDDYTLTMWHELGHANHELGLLDGLVAELAANEWALINYEGDDLQGLINQLKRCILTYIDHGENYSQSTPALEAVAKTLQVHHLITWTKP